MKFVGILGYVVPLVFVGVIVGVVVPIADLTRDPVFAKERIRLNVTEYNSFDLTLTWSGNSSWYNVSNGINTYNVTANYYKFTGLQPDTQYQLSVASEDLDKVYLNQTTRRLKVLFLAGQSNMQGQGDFYNPAIDVSHPKVFQYVIGDQYSQVRTDRSGQVVLAQEPMDDGGNAGGLVIGNGLAFARRYMQQYPNETFLIVNAAVSSSAFSYDPLSWTGNIYTRARAAMLAVSTRYPTSELIGIGWIQGESDVNAGATIYRTKLINLFNQFRTLFYLGNATTPIMVVGMVPEWIGSDVNRLAINYVHSIVPNLLPFTTYRAGPTNGVSTVNGIHFSASGQRAIANLFWDSFTKAYNNSKPVPIEVVGTVVSSTSMTVTFDGYGTSFRVNYNNLFATTNTKSATIAGLTAGATYVVTVQGNSAYGLSEPSAPINVIMTQ